MNVKFAKSYYVKKQQLIIKHPCKYDGSTCICGDGRRNLYIQSFETREEAESYVTNMMQHAIETRPNELPEKLQPTFPSNASAYGIGGLIYRGPIENSVICEVYCTYQRCILGCGHSNAVVKRKNVPFFTVYENYVIFDGYFPYVDEELEVTDRCQI